MEPQDGPHGRRHIHGKAYSGKPTGEITLVGANLLPFKGASTQHTHSETPPLTLTLPLLVPPYQGPAVVKASISTLLVSPTPNPTDGIISSAVLPAKRSRRGPSCYL